MLRFKEEPRHCCCLAAVPLCPHPYIIHQMSRETYMFASSRAGNDPIHLCISNRAQTHRKNLAKVCYMKVWTDD